MKGKNLDLTVGSIPQKLMLYILPLLASSLFQQLYAAADAVIVGQFIGKQGLAAIDGIHALLRMPVSLFNGLSVGMSIVISQHFGAKRWKDVDAASHTSILFGAVIGIILSLLGVSGAAYFLRWMRIPEDIYPLTLSYLRIYYAGLFFMVVYNTCAGILRAVGNTRTPFVILVMTGILNVAADILFVGFLHMNVAGAAYATVLSEVCSVVLVLKAVHEAEGMELFHVKKLRIHSRHLKAILKLGIPCALQSIVYPIANMIIQSAINTTGTDHIAAWAVSGKMDLVIWLIADSSAQAVSTFTAQNIGAGNTERADRGILLAAVFSSLVLFVMGAGLYVFCEPIAKLFINRESYDILPYVKTYTRFQAFLYFMYAPGEVYCCAIQGIGNTVKPMLISVLATCVFRILWILFVVPVKPDMMTIITSYPLSWTLASAAFIIYYYGSVRKMMFFMESA